MLLGVLCVITQEGSYSVLSPIVKGPIAVAAGILMCSLGLWGVIATVRENNSTRPPE